MSGPLRSKQGCWTCRLRKKKCDEAHPQCTVCEDLSITCYGYGSRPEWMDGGEKEKAMSNSIKQIVKHTSRRKGASRLGFSASRFLKQRSGQNFMAPVVRIAPKETNDSSSKSASSPESNHQPTVTPPSDYTSSVAGTEVQSHDQEHLLSHDMEPFSAVNLSTLSGNDMVLLMHFLDTVFPLQYPMYKPGVLEGGRGWLLALLLRTKPLYHAALALSVYHRRKILADLQHDHPCNTARLVEQEHHLAICLTEFQKTIKSVQQLVSLTCPKNGLGIMASITQLVFFELFAGEDDSWQIHLHAATDMFRRGYDEGFTLLGLDERTQVLLSTDMPLSEDDFNIAEEVAMYRFLGGAIMWLDIIYSITNGTSPALSRFHSQLLSTTSQLKMHDVMGCENWVMLQISRISSLYEYKMSACKEGGLATKSEQVFSAGNIKQSLQQGLNEDALQSFGISNTGHCPIQNPTVLITRMFTCMAKIYLHLVVCGFRSLELLDTTIAEAIETLQTKMPAPLWAGIVSPLFIIGSVARQGETDFFRHVFSASPVMDPTLEHRTRILPLLEAIWKKRELSPEGFDWGEALQLSNGPLLLV
ncbi:fungal-specific transcription factor domain-containing protein [Tricladium varicosporioides]|nr:fungal-specific transcription factor domain-containing protein [Hymenoscyphus varicosporioides]